MNDLIRLIRSGLALFFRPVVIGQLLIVLLPLLVYLLWLRNLVRRRRQQLIWFADVLVLALLRLLLVPFKAMGQPVGLSEFFLAAYLVWVLLEAFAGLLRSVFQDAEVNRLYLRLINPLYVVILADQVIVQFIPRSEMARMPLFPNISQSFTLLTLVLCVLFPYFLVVGSEYPVKALTWLLKRLLSVSESGTRAMQLLLRYVVVGVGILWLLLSIGLNSSAVAAIAGGLSIGVGFGVKELISNFLSGLWLLFEGSVRPGDILFIGDDPCEVRALGLRAATLWRQRDNAELVIPNQEFFTTTTTTYTGTDHLRRGEVQVSAAYRHDPDVVLPLLLQAALSVPIVLTNPAPLAFLTNYGDSSIDYIIRYWIEDPLTNLTAKSMVAKAVWRTFADNGIEIPFPQRVLHPPEDS